MFRWLRNYPSFRRSRNVEDFHVPSSVQSLLNDRTEQNFVAHTATWSLPAHLRGLVGRHQKLQKFMNSSSRALSQDCHDVGICLSFYTVHSCQLLDDSNSHQSHLSLIRQRMIQWLDEYTVFFFSCHLALLKYIGKPPGQRVPSRFDSCHKTVMTQAMGYVREAVRRRKHMKSSFCTVTFILR